MSPGSVLAAWGPFLMSKQWVPYRSFSHQEELVFKP